MRNHQPIIPVSALDNATTSRAGEHNSPLFLCFDIKTLDNRLDVRIETTPDTAGMNAVEWTDRTFSGLWAGTGTTGGYIICTP